MARRLLDDRGASLVEVLVAVIVLGTAGAAAIGGLYTSIRVSDVHREQSEAAAIARDETERIAGAPDLACGSAAGSYAALAAQVDVKPGYTPAVGPIESWTGSAWGACVTGELQRVTVVVSSGDGVTERSVVVVRAP
jgi:type II secretory pathway pseudopilin PulG